jgi:hypothetical protein
MGCKASKAVDPQEIQPNKSSKTSPQKTGSRRSGKSNSFDTVGDKNDRIYKL